VHEFKWEAPLETWLMPGVRYPGQRVQFEQTKQWRGVNLGLGLPASVLAAFSGATALASTLGGPPGDQEFQADCEPVRWCDYGDPSAAPDWRAPLAVCATRAAFREAITASDSSRAVSACIGPILIGGMDAPALLTSTLPTPSAARDRR
jgi:hypothetical protein